MTGLGAGAGSAGNRGEPADDQRAVEMSSRPSARRPSARSARPPVLLAVLVTTVLVGLGAACGGDDDGADALSATAQEGRRISSQNGCAACHGADGQGGAGPGWQGLYGAEVQLEDGSVVVADEAYLERAIVEPDAEISAGYQLRMPVNNLSADEVDAVIAYIRELGGEPGGAAGGGEDG